MKLLFLMRHPGYTRNLESTLRLLAERGHDIHLAFEVRDRVHVPGALRGLVEDCPRITYAAAPRPPADAWSALVRQTRVTTDYLRYLEPRYRDAPKLRERCALRVAPAWRRLAEQPLLRTPAGQAVLRHCLRALQDAAPAQPEIDQFLRAQRPDVLLLTPLVGVGSGQADYIRGAQRLGVPTTLCVASWDNLTNKGLIHEVPDLVTVWNEAQQREAVELHGVPAERVAVTGAVAYDHWFSWRPSRSREEFCGRVGLRADRPFVLYLCSSPFIAPAEVGFVERWVAETRRRAGGRLSEVGVLVRPHPQNAAQWQEVDLSGLGEVAIWPRAGADPANPEAKAEYYDTIHHCAAVVGINTSALIESAILGRPAYTVLAEEFRETQAGTLHFQHLLWENGGPLRVADSFEEHAEQVAEGLECPAAAQEQNRRFVATFVRPYGREVAATPKLASAIERLAAEPGAAARRRPLGAALLGAVLTPPFAVGRWFTMVRRGFKMVGRRFKMARRRLFKMVGRRFKMVGRRFKMVGRRFKMVGRRFKMVGRRFKMERPRLLLALPKKLARGALRRVLAFEPVRRRMAERLIPVLSVTMAGSASKRVNGLRSRVVHISAAPNSWTPSSNGTQRVNIYSRVHGVGPGYEAAAVEVVARAVDQLANASDVPIIAGPWRGEVEFELLYWIPLLNWAVARRPELAERLIVVSRGGTEHWYDGVSHRYVDIFDFMSPEAFPGGKKEQVNVSPFDADLVECTRRRLGLEQVELLHPSLMYGLFRQLFKSDSVQHMSQVAEYRRIPRPEPGMLSDELPDEYVAVRFDFNSSFPDTAENRRFVASTIRTLADQTNVLLLSTEAQFDDHGDFDAIHGANIFRIKQIMRPRSNLELQTAAVAGARAFYGSYGGLVYLPPYLGIPSVGFYSEAEQLNHCHLEMASRIFRSPEWGSCLALHTDQLRLIEALAERVIGSETGPAAG